MYLITVWVRNNRVQCNNRVPNNCVGTQQPCGDLPEPQIAFFQQKKTALSTPQCSRRASRIPDCHFSKKKKTTALSTPQCSRRASRIPELASRSPDCFFLKKISRELTPILSEAFQMSYFALSQPNISVYIITMCNAIIVCPKPCGHKISDIEYCM